MTESNVFPPPAPSRRLAFFTTQPRRSATAALLLLILMFMACGCSIRRALTPVVLNRLTIRQPNEEGGKPTTLTLNQGVYRQDDPDHRTFVLYQGNLDAPERIVTIRTFWQPHAGKTPLDPTATNATIHYVDLRNGQIGVYSGAGFVLPSTPATGLGGLRLQVSQSNLRLDDHSEDYPQAPGVTHVNLSGSVNVHRDDIQLLEAVRRAEQLMLQRLNYPRFVNARHSPQNGVKPGT